MKKFLTAILVSMSLCTNYVYAQSSALAIQPPPAANYAPCAGLTGNDSSICRQAADQTYQRNLTSYSAALAQRQAEEAANQKYASAKDAALDAEQQNKKGKRSYGIAQLATMAVSGVLLQRFIASCKITPPGCIYPFLAGSIVMAGFSVLSGKQADIHQTRASDSCILANKISTTQSDCGTAPRPFDPSAYPNNIVDTSYNPNNLVDSNGNCTGSQEVCDQLRTSLPAGISLKDFKGGLSAFASGKVPFKVNADGSITRNSDGKKFDPNQFNTLEGLVATGLTTEQAKSTLADFAKSKSAADDLAKADTSKDNGVGSGGFLDDSAFGAKGGAIGGAGLGNGELSAAGQLDDASAKGRNIASAEGLVKDFNGEMIGVQGDNIFKMMNRRYILKNKQDAFILSAP